VMVMSRARIVKDEVFEKNTRFLVIYLETKNACLILLSEAEDQLGTLTAAVPPRERLLGPPVSSVFMGDRNTAIARTLAERLAARTQKIALVSIYLKTISESEAAPILLKLVEKVLSAPAETSEEGITT